MISATPDDLTARSAISRKWATEPTIDSLTRRTETGGRAGLREAYYNTG
jgi:hypothetical protein